MEKRSERRSGCVRPEEPGYPSRILAFAKPLRPLYYLGDLSLAEQPSIAIVGSRSCTMYGKTVAQGLARRAAECGVVVVSGLARGIDTAAHAGAIKAGGSTIAVLGNGTDVFYPAVNGPLQREIGEKGLLLSEYPPGTGANRFHFPERNRIISSLADAVVIVEAGTRSGSLITAECAEEQGKPVYAVPGNITSPASLGTNKLIRDRAEPLLFFDDVLRDIGADPALPEHRFPELGPEERRILEVLQKNGETTTEDLRRHTQLTPAEVSGLLSILEIKGLIICEMGKVMIAKF